MPGFKDRIGDQYGRLTVISHAGKDHRNKHLWLCKCTCGNTKIVVADNLSSKKSKSCGCLNQEFLAKKGNQFNLLYDRWNRSGCKPYMKPYIDHITPKSKGGTNALSNLQFLSWFENRCKNDMSQEEWDEMKSNILEYFV
jgi:hypothetical protein